MSQKQQFDPCPNRIRGVSELKDFSAYIHIYICQKLSIFSFYFVLPYNVYVFILTYVYIHKYIPLGFHMTGVKEILSVC